MIKTVQCAFCGNLYRPRKTKKVLFENNKVSACDDCHSKLKNGEPLKKI